jgi:hypothetical protein
VKEGTGTRAPPRTNHPRRTTLSKPERDDEKLAAAIDVAYIELRDATKRIDALLVDAPREITQTEWRDTIRDANCRRPGL